MCQGKELEFTHRHGGCSCCCSHQHLGFARRFLSKEEKKARLERYLKDLQEEAKAVQGLIEKMEEDE